MKVFILNAGFPTKGRGFPSNCPPKCVLHLKGDTILEKQIRFLHQVGLHDITVVVGYHHWEVIKLINEKNLPVKTVISKNHFEPSSTIEAVRNNTNGEDIMMIGGDVIFNEQSFRKALSLPDALIYCGHQQIIRKDMLYVLDHYDRYIPNKDKGTGQQLYFGILQLLKEYKAVILKNEELDEYDDYKRFDESKKK